MNESMHESMDVMQMRSDGYQLQEMVRKTARGKAKAMIL
jgi:hypothetical protein